MIKVLVPALAGRLGFWNLEKALRQATSNSNKCLPSSVARASAYSKTNGSHWQRLFDSVGMPPLGPVN
jgi:hypothetical protein